MRSKHNIRRSSSRTLALEPRLLFDGAAMVAAQDVHEAQAKASTADKSSHDSQDTHAFVEGSKDHAVTDGRTSDPSQSIALIDARLPNQVELSQQLQAQGVQVHLVQSSESGLTAIGDALATAQNVSHLQIYSHTDNGHQQLGTDAVSDTSVHSVAASNTSWQYYLSNAASIQVVSDQATTTDSSPHKISQEAALTGSDLGSSTAHEIILSAMMWRTGSSS